MKNKKDTFSLLLGLGVVVGLLWGFYKVIAFVFKAFSTLDSNVTMAIIAGSATILASTITVVATRYYQAKIEREAAHRDKKIELYDEFLSKLFDVFLGDEKDKTNEDNLIPFLREVQRKLILWSGPEVVVSYAEWNEILTTQGDSPKAESMIKLIDFFLALRKDLGHSNKNIKKDHLIRFLLRNSELFMKMYKENPDITFDEITQAEEMIKNKANK